ncbi:MAG TPA: hypothetical protein DD490_34050, partial [Acidobacteria bacterium]|nr:hypothetical protein [Acidobacteriota bacterium]
LDFSKIESGHMELEQAPFQLREVIEGALDLLAGKAAEKRIDLLYEIADAGPATIEGDSSRLRQVLVNLLNNALKFTERGEVMLTVHPVATVDGLVELQFDVRDTGIGIAPEAMGRLFKSFSQVDSSTARRFGGTGLGLAISKRLVELMGGEVGLRSEEGQGTTLWFTLPLCAAPGRPAEPAPQETSVEPAPPDPAPVAGSSPPRVLLVENDPVSQLVTAQLLEKLGCHVDHALNGTEAVARCSRERFDMILMDCYMPEMDGFEATQAIRRLAGDRRNVPIIALTASVMPEDREKCERAGMDDFLAKPIRADELRRATRKWVLPRLAR